MSDNDKAIRAAKLTLGALMEKRRAKTAKDRAGGQVAPSKYLPDVPRQVHANGGPVIPAQIGYVPLVAPQTPYRLVTAPPPPPNQFTAAPLAGVSSTAGSVNRIADIFAPEREEEPAEEQATQEAQTAPQAEPSTYAEGVSPEAAAAMDALRAAYGQPLEIISSYRDREHNREVGGADHSQHVHGNAFDIDTSHLTPEERIALANQAWEAGFRGFGFYDNNMHFDVGDPRAWGPSYSYESLPEWSYGFVQQYLPDTYARFGFADGGEVDNLSRFLAGSKVRDYSSRTSSKDARHNDEFPPLKVYHGTRATFDAFRPSGEGTTTFMGIPVKHKRTGIFFSESPEFSEGFANPPGQKKTGTVGAYHLNIQNPLHADEDGFVDPKDRERLKAVGIDPQFVDNHLGDPRTMWEHFDGEDGEWFVNKLKEAGYDGVRFHEEDPDTGKLAATWVAFHPTQVKSATGNVGTYDPSDERFNYADGGEVADLGAAREQKQLQVYHAGVMDDVRNRMTAAMDAHQKAVDQGVFDGYEVGDTLQAKAGPMRITGRFMAKWKPTSNQLSHFDRMGAKPTVIEHEGQQYIPMLRYQTGREGDPDWQEGHAYLDLIRSAGYPKMGGLRAVKADGGSIADRSPMFEGVSEHLRDEAGKPMELWHGTPVAGGFEAFDDKKVGSERDSGFYGRGHYLTPDYDVAEDYSNDDEGQTGTVMGPLHAALKNPYIWDVSSEESRAALAKDLTDMGLKRDKMDPWDIVMSHELDRFMGHMRKRGHDGVIVKGPDWQDLEGSQVREVVVFKPTAIKHRDAEIGDPNDPRIMRRDGGSAKGAR